MIVVNDLCGDENSLEVIYLTKYIQDSLYKALLSIEPVSYEDSIKVVESQYRKVLTDVYTKEGYDPQVKCELQQDCQKCGTAMYELDEDRLCPGCSYMYYNWEEQDWSGNKLFYENDLEHLEELPSKEKM